ncbi:MAG: hypothetical protein RL641_643 [Candidatus Parcubacteria bacterium]|jgi:competence protein ComGC
MNTYFKNKGITLVEALVYVALLSILLISIIPYLLNVTTMRSKFFSKVDLYSQARFVNRRLSNEMRNMYNLSHIQSGTELVGTSGYLGYFSTTLLDFARVDVLNGVLRISRDNGTTWTPLTSSPVTVTSLVFTDGSAGINFRHVFFHLEMVVNNDASKSGSKESLVLEGSVSPNSSNSEF